MNYKGGHMKVEVKVRGCSQIMSAENWGVQTPPPPPVSPFHDLFSSVCRFKGKYFELMETDTSYKINNWFLELLGIPGIEG